MAIMEGKELAPDARIYETLIKAFATARDPTAAEYYFWEMRRKGLHSTPDAYESLLEAYAMGQSVGARSYGTVGTYLPKTHKTHKTHLSYCLLY
jgi:pentatricopeptide repeat protein